MESEDTPPLKCLWKETNPFLIVEEEPKKQ